MRAPCARPTDRERTKRSGLNPVTYPPLLKRLSPSILKTVSLAADGALEVRLGALHEVVALVRAQSVLLGAIDLNLELARDIVLDE
jgi:hypothetical protein